jgi:AraC-like DNA-binding protein
MVARETETDVPPAPSRLLRLSTEMLPERERFSALQEEFAQKILKMDLIDRGARCPRIEVAFMPLGAVAAGAVRCTSAEWVRHNHHLKDCSDDFRLDIVAKGPIQFSHAGEEGICDIGWAHLVDQGRPHRGFAPCDISVRNITVQAAALKALVAHPEDLAGRHVRPGPALRLLDGYLRALTSLEEPPSSELARIIGEHLLDLVAAALGPTAEAAEIVAKRGVKAARLRAILAEIAQRFSEPNFDLDNIAATLGLSRRYIQQLLQETGKSFTEHLAERRLEHSFAMLTDRRSLHLTIIDIALAAGFSDVSHFNRLFRQRFGETPSGVRVGAIATEQT